MKMEAAKKQELCLWPQKDAGGKEEKRKERKWFEEVMGNKIYVKHARNTVQIAKKTSCLVRQRNNEKNQFGKLMFLSFISALYGI